MSQGPKDEDFEKLKRYGQAKNEIYKPNFQTNEYDNQDRREKQVTFNEDLLNGSIKKKSMPVIKASPRMVSAYKDEEVKPHYSAQYRQSIEKFPNVFRRSNGEFSAYASAFSAHKIVQCKNFFNSQKNFFMKSWRSF